MMVSMGIEAFGETETDLLQQRESDYQKKKSPFAQGY
jgi:hypothetical protein